VRLLLVPGVHAPLSDTRLLAEAMLEQGVAGRDVADLCCGSGALAIAAARAGASSVEAVDVSLRATLATALNARLNRCHVRVRRGDLFGALGDGRFDVIVSNPPYVPAATDALPRHRATTPLDGGRDGRALIDRVCSEAAGHLRPGGAVLVVHSSVCDPERTRDMLAAYGLEPAEMRRVRGALGPVMRGRRRMLQARGLLGDDDHEDLVVLRGVRTESS
jgi:release factor glutamine methyltransferase